MRLVKPILRPGINKQLTAYLNEGGYSDGNLVRFEDGLPEKIGGWVKLTDSTVDGVARGLIAWVTLAGEQTMAIGTACYLYVYQGGSLTDITPAAASGTLGADPFTTTDGDATVNVEDTSHGREVGNIVFFDGATDVNGIDPDGYHTVTVVVDVDNYEFEASTAATGSGSGGGSAVDYVYLIDCGLVDGIEGLGWSFGTWSRGTWSSAGTPAVLAPRTWSFTLWGEDLIANPRDAGIYLWDASAGLTNNRATIIANAPTASGAVLVSIAQHLISFGAEDSGSQDKLLIKWSDAGDYTDWTPTATNQAGSQRVTGGSEIVNAVSTRGIILVLTDEGATGMQFIGGGLVFAFAPLGHACGLIGPNAVTDANGVVYWMGRRHFFRFSGDVAPIPCTVQDHVFGDFNFTQAAKTYAGQISERQEILWFYCSADSTEVDRVVAYDYDEDVWWIGEIDRTSWVDLGPTQKPVGISSDGVIYEHESGVDADGEAMGDFVESGYFDLADGDEYLFLDRIIPDFAEQEGTVNITIKVRRYPNAAVTTKGPYPATTSTEKIDFRARGSQAAVRYASSGLGSYWRMGAPRFRIQPSGGR